MEKVKLVKLRCIQCGDTFNGNPAQEKECLRCGGDLVEVRVQRTQRTK